MAEMKTTVNLNTAQWHPFGKIINHLYYHNDDLCELAPGRSGFPHNGGDHTLTITGDSGDVVAWLDLLVSSYPGAKMYITEIKKEIRKKILQGSVSATIKLKDFHVYQNNFPEYIP